MDKANTLTVPAKHMALARHAARVIVHTLEQRGLQPVVRRHVLTDNGYLRILFADLDTRRLEGRLAAYTHPDVLHQMSTNLRGMPVALSNTTGLRYAVLLNRPKPLPKQVEFPGAERGKLLIGVRSDGQTVSVAWDELGHLLVAGMTRSGKSTFLRSLVYQALADGARLLLGDRPLTTFSMLDGHAALMMPIADTPQGYLTLAQRALAICEERKIAFSQARDTFPEKLSEYNAWAVRHRREPLPRVLVVLDEYNATANELGRSFEQAVSSLVFQGLKFGVHLVAAAQEFDKKTLGSVRDQFGAVIAFKVKSAAVARNVGVAKAERIPASRQGLAVTDRWGLVQTFYLPKERMIEVGARQQPAIALSEQERTLMCFAWEQLDGRVSIPKLVAWAQEMGWESDWSKYKAEQRAREWELRGWVRKDPQRDNARYITAEFAQTLGFSPETQKPQKPPETGRNRPETI